MGPPGKSPTSSAKWRADASFPPAMDAAERTKGPFLIDFRIDPEANVYPIVPLGKSLNDFWEAPDK